ncbi:PepSY domain-containing protein [Veillonella intestinalis]|uniref:PepSY domain-containing protein n=1 Tax=Veillonella intestinalis TaxID=2941341 RepID=UPI00203B7D10|nr:PepSY domain-containing protein [Veillonella intestinalis]
MKKKSFASVLACAFAVGIASIAVPQPVAAADMNPTIIVEGPNQSMILTMRQVAGIFLAKYPNSAVHSIALKPDRGRFAYEVTGYTLKNTYKISVDVITSKILKEEVDGKEKDIPNKVFNPLNVIEPKKAEAVAVANIGGDALSKGWKLEAEEGNVKYEVTIYHTDDKLGLVQQDVLINASTGDVITKTLPKKVEIPDEDDDGFVLWGD